MFRIGSSTGTESRLVIGKEGNEWKVTNSRHGVSFQGDENVLKSDSGKGCVSQ